MRRFVSIALVLAAALAGASPARAKENTNLDKAREQARTQQEATLMAILHDADAKRQAIEESIAKLADRLNAIEAKLSRMRPALERAQKERERANDAVAIADESLRRGRARLGLNALSLYATGRWTDAFTVLSSPDVASLASAQVYIDSVISSNSSIIDGFENARVAVVETRRLVEKRTKKIIDEQRAIQEEEQRLLKLTESRQQQAVQLTSALVARTQAIAAITGDPSAFSIVANSYGKATGSIKLLVGAAQYGQPVETPKAGAVWWPVQGNISSYYGWRIHPIFKQKSFHTGIDIAAPYGTAIRAARAGVVVDVVYLGAYGLVTVVDHGYSLATMYAHQSRTVVHAGDQVQAGQIIGAIGCTGWCTGPHIHFEVWSSSTPMNPLRWLS